MSDAQMTKEQIEEIALTAREPSLQGAVLRPRDLAALCTLALHGLTKEPLEWPETDAGLTAAHIEEACETIMRGNTHRSDVPGPLSTLRRLALRGLEAERAATEPLLVSVEKILDDHSAWIARPSPEVSRSVAMAAAIRATVALDDRIEIAARETAERVREETLEECAMALEGDADAWEARARTWSMEGHEVRADEADNNAALLRQVTTLIRALKKGPSDANP